MKKLKSDSKFAQLTAEQRETLDGWLFDDNLTYAETLLRLKNEFGLVFSRSGLSRYYSRIARDGMKDRFHSMREDSRVINDIPLDMPALEAAAMKLVIQELFHTAIEKPGQTKELCALAKILMLREDVSIRKRWVLLEEIRRIEQADEKELQNERLEEKRQAMIDEIQSYWKNSPPATPMHGFPSNTNPDPDPNPETRECAKEESGKSQV